MTMTAMSATTGLRKILSRANWRIAPAAFAPATLEIFLPPDWPESGAPLAWRRHGGHGPVQHGQASDPGVLAEMARRARLHVWTPAGATLLTRVNLPTRRRAKILQALPYALEDQLLEDPAQLHFAWTAQADGSLVVAVTARERVRAWLGGLTTVGLRPQALCPVTLAVPLADDGWSLAFADGHCWLRTGALTGFACPVSPATPPALLQAVVREARAAGRLPPALTVYDAPDGFDARAWSAALGLPLLSAAAPLREAPPATLPMLNLLQGEFAPAIQVATFLRPLRLAAVVLAIAVIGGLTVDLWEWWWLHRLHVSSRQEMTRLFLESFPDQKVVVDSALQMQRQIEALQTRQGVPGARDFLPLLRRITPVLGANAGSGVRALTYADRELTVTVLVPDRPALDRLAADLGRVGLSAEILAADSRAEGLQGQLRIRAPAAVDAARIKP